MIYTRLLNALLLYVEAVLACLLPTPIEIHQRMLRKSPDMMDTRSSPDTFAGRTTLGSGQATVTVSTRQVGADSMINISLQAALVAAFASSGRTTIASGVATATVSTPAVYSGDVILHAMETATAQTSAQGLRVNSVVDGVSFALATSNGLNTVAAVNAMWQIAGKDANEVKVNTISPGNFVTFGWSDGRVRPYDTTIMWENRRSA